MPKVNVDQFYGIEIDGFSARIAETSVWMTDHLANNEISRAYGDSYVRIPPEGRANILNADALETDWNEALPAKECSYVLGNPPFLGAKVMSGEQRGQVGRVAGLGGGGGTLDYVAAWFFKSVEYAPDARIVLGSTNSVTQGEQVGQLWPAILENHEIAFAHKSFEWDSDAACKAHVHVVVIGLARKGAAARKRLFDGKVENPRHISPYLMGFGNAVPFVSESARRLNGLPKLAMGSKPIDGGHYILTAGEKDGLLAREPGAAKFLRPYVGAREFINGGERWILALQNAEPSELKAMPEVMKRVEAVKRYRLKSRSPGTRKLAETPTRYHLNVLPEKPFLLVPSVSSERREYVPIGYAEPPVIPSNLTMAVQDSTLGLFGLITSNMHMAWLAGVGGRLESRFRYTAGMVYNTFPVPDTDLDSLEPHAQGVMDARAGHPSQTLADLYDPNLMPADLRKSHEKLDRAADRLYRGKPFKDDHERLEFLLERYGAMVQKNQRLIPEPKRGRKRRKF